ncbi:MAG: hypothetical protein H2069_07590 [Legionella sp.]|nr:hypothetical protein [Legionella sp.]
MNQADPRHLLFHNVIHLLLTSSTVALRRSMQNATSASITPEQEKNQRTGGFIAIGILGALVALCVLPPILKKCWRLAGKKGILKRLKKTTVPVQALPNKKIEEKIMMQDCKRKQALEEAVKTAELHYLFTKVQVIPTDEAVIPPLTGNEIDTLQKYGSLKSRQLLNQYSAIYKSLTSKRNCAVLVSIDPEPQAFSVYSNLALEPHPEQLFYVIYEDETKQRNMFKNDAIMQLVRKKTICDYLKASQVFYDRNLLKNLKIYKITKVVGSEVFTCKALEDLKIILRDIAEEIALIKTEQTSTIPDERNGNPDTNNLESRPFSTNQHFFMQGTKNLQTTVPINNNLSSQEQTEVGKLSFS